MWREKIKVYRAVVLLCIDNNKRKGEEQYAETSLKADVRPIEECKNGETWLMHSEILFKL